MRAASAASRGFSSNWSSTTTVVSAARTVSPAFMGTAKAFCSASRRTYSSGGSSLRRSSWILGTRTTKSIPAALRISRRRGEFEASTSTRRSLFARHRGGGSRGCRHYRRRHFFRPRVQLRRDQLLANLLEFRRSWLAARGHNVRFRDLLRRRQILLQVILDSIMHQPF